MKAPTLRKAFSLALVALVMATSFGFSSVAHAQDADTDESKGTGKLTTHGDGIALLAGRGIVDLRGNGTLWVKDAAGDATIEVRGHGEKKEFSDGWIQYSGFNGTAHIKGSRIGVIVAGVDIDLSAKGRGRVILWGHGSYEVNGQDGKWKASGLGTQVKLAPTDMTTNQ